MRVANDMAAPGFADVLKARIQIAPYLKSTALYGYPALDEATGQQLLIKHENHQPVGAFKVRGGINLVSQLTDDERKRGLATASTGNHGQSIAYAARLFGVRAIIFVPENANPAKTASIRALGAKLVMHGHNYDEAREYCEEQVAEHGYRYVHSGDEPLLIAGVATETLEIVEQAPDIDALIVPIGGGSGAAGACIVSDAMGRSFEVIGVQSAASPAAFKSWEAGSLVEGSNETFAEGLATGTAFGLPQSILRDMLSDFILVTDDEIRNATLLMIEKTRNLVEPSGAASLAAAIRLKDRLAGKKVAIICSGGNVSPDQLRQMLATPA